MACPIPFPHHPRALTHGVDSQLCRQEAAGSPSGLWDWKEKCVWWPEERSHLHMTREGWLGGPSFHQRLQCPPLQFPQGQ